MSRKKLVVIGFLGNQLDQGGKDARRWERWRPSISLFQQEDLLIDRMELLHSGQVSNLLKVLTQDIAALSPTTELRPHALPMRDPWDFEEVYACLFDFFRAYPFDTEKEEYWLHITTGTHVAQICLFLMTEAKYFPGKLLQTSPAGNRKSAFSGDYSVIDLDLSRYNQIAQRFSTERQEGASFLKSGIATCNPAFNQMIEEIECVAMKSKAPMLLMGPTGAGKSFLARRVYELKKSRHQIAGRFVEVNCATLHGDGAASNLFGHIKGAFTGAVNQRAGLLRNADQGLLFLDEIGELGMDEQAMLLKAIEEKRFYPVGADEEVQSDFQLIAGTNRDLAQEVARGRFREDLFARINLWTYALPGLAQRREDIGPNLEYLLKQFSLENGQMVRFNKEAREQYMRFASSHEAIWSANFRDLSASVMRMATLAQAGRITEAVVAQEVLRLGKSWQFQTSNSSLHQSSEVDLSTILTQAALDELDLFDSMQLQQLISVCRQSRSMAEAGRRLFAASRRAKEKPNDTDRLKKYLSKFGLHWEQLHQ